VHAACPFPHNDWAALDALLAQQRRQFERVLIVVEGIYSMDGDFPDLPKFVEIRRRHKAFLMVDEAHSFGVMGAEGPRDAASISAMRPGDAVDIWMGTLSKSLAGCGGYIAGETALVEHLKFLAPGVPVQRRHAAARGRKPRSPRCRRCSAEPERVATLHARGALFLELARAAGIDTGGSAGISVIPAIVGGSLRAARVSAAVRARHQRAADTVSRGAGESSRACVFSSPRSIPRPTFAMPYARCAPNSTIKRLRDAPANPAVLCRLYLHAVLPCLNALGHVRPGARMPSRQYARNDRVPRKLGGLAVPPYGCRTAPSTCWSAMRRVDAVRDPAVLQRSSPEHIFFGGTHGRCRCRSGAAGGSALLARFTRLTERLAAVLDGHPDVLATAEGRALHARLSLIAAGLGLSPLAMGDGPAREALARAPAGLASFTIEGAQNATVWFDHGSADFGESGWGTPPRRPDVAISFIDAATCLWGAAGGNRHHGGDRQRRDHGRRASCRWPTHSTLRWNA
jgi:hypothetical protein